MENKKPVGRRDLLPITVVLKYYTLVQNKLKGAFKISYRL